ncbi:MAG: MFS transporter [Halobacteriota archaeon]
MSTAADLRGVFTALWNDLRSDGRGWILLFVSIGWFLTLGVRIVYPTLLPQVTAEFGVGYTTTGVLVSVLWVSYALLQFPGGIVADRIGERAVLTLSILVTAGAVVAIVLSSTLVVFVIGTISLGVGAGFYGTTRITVLSAIYDAHDTTAISISQASGNVGNVVLPVVAGVGSAYFGWRMGFGVLLPLMVATAVGFWRFVPKRATDPIESDSVRRTLADVASVMTNRRVVIVTTILFLTMFMYQSVTGFLPTYLTEIKGLSSRRASVLFGLFFASAIVVQFASGVVSDRYGRRYALSIFMGASVPGFALVSRVGDLYALVVLVVVLSCMLGGFPPAHAYAVRAFPSEIQGSGYGLVRTLYIGFGATGPLVVGVLADTGLFDEAYLLLGGVALLTSVVSITLLPALE